MLLAVAPMARIMANRAGTKSLACRPESEDRSWVEHRLRGNSSGDSRFSLVERVVGCIQTRSLCDQAKLDKVILHDAISAAKSPITVDSTHNGIQKRTQERKKFLLLCLQLLWLILE